MRRSSTYGKICASILGVQGLCSEPTTVCSILQEVCYVNPRAWDRAAVTSIHTFEQYAPLSLTNQALKKIYMPKKLIDETDDDIMRRIVKAIRRNPPVPRSKRDEEAQNFHLSTPMNNRSILCAQ